MSNESILIAVGGDAEDAWLPVFAEHYPDENVLWYEPKLDDETLAGCRYAIVWAPDAGLLSRMAHLKVLFSLGAGVDHLTRSGIELPDIPIVRYVGEDLTNRMSEWVALQCLLHLRQHERYRSQQRARIWREHAQPGADEVRVGIMGLGVLGLDAARKLKVLGFQVHGWSRHNKTIQDMETFAGESQLDAFLAKTDFLVSLLPLTRETENLVDATFLERLARDGVFGAPVYINAGRGKTQNDADIARALHAGMLAGASLDVFESEPLPRDNPLWDAPRLIMTPHVAAWSKRPDVVHYVMKQINRLRAGLPLENVIDPKAGY